MIVSMKNEAGLVRQVKVGFCWTAFFFGPLPFFFRGMPQNGFIWCCLPVIGNFVLPFKMNKYTAHYYLEHGYKPIGKGWNTAAPLWGVALPSTGDHRESQEDMLGRDEHPSDTKFKLKTWHMVVAGLLIVGAIFGNHKKAPSAPETEPKPETAAAANIAIPASVAVAASISGPAPVAPVIATPAASVEPAQNDSAAVGPQSNVTNADAITKSAFEIPAVETAAVAQSWTPSFDCAKASNGQERLICSSRELSAADVKLGQAYKWALSNTTDKGVALKRLQNEWRKNERDACSDVRCMLKAYQKRIDELGA
jgi:uncharacterized protein YecT (DUF1311 family)